MPSRQHLASCQKWVGRDCGYHVHMELDETKPCTCGLELVQRLEDVAASYHFEADWVPALIREAASALRASQSANQAREVQEAVSPPTQKQCAHGHTKRQVGCVSCVLVWPPDLMTTLKVVTERMALAKAEALPKQRNLKLASPDAVSLDQLVRELIAKWRDISGRPHRPTGFRLCADELESALRASQAVPCVCQVDDGLVQEWVSKARAVAKQKGFVVHSPAKQGCENGHVWTSDDCAFRDGEWDWRCDCGQLERDFPSDAVEAYFAESTPPQEKRDE